MGEHRPFRYPCRAPCIQNDAYVIRCAIHGGHTFLLSSLFFTEGCQNIIFLQNQHVLQMGEFISLRDVGAELLGSDQKG